MSDYNPYYLAAFAVANLVAASICGALSGALAAHKLTVRREKEFGRASRKRDFLIFMRTWRADFIQPRFGPGSENGAPGAFMGGVIPFEGYVTSIQDDFTGMSRIRFDEVVAQIPKTYTHDEKKILRAMDDIIEYVKNAV